MTAPFPSPGDMIGRFRVLAQLGAGGMGVVYDALEVNLDRRVALKVISPMYADDPEFRARFVSEARALASLDSPHVVQVYAHGEEDGYLYIATQLVPDGDLGQTITRWGPAPHGKAAELLEQVAAGLADAHAAGLVHRDIKPANVLVRRRGGTTVQAYLGDFGIARRVDAEATRVGGAAAGTPSYMAPELHQGAQAAITTDIYSLGCVLWVTLTGQPPYPGATEFEIATGHLTRPVPQLAGDTPLVETLNRVLRIAMAKEPGHRYRTALDLRDDLREAARMSGDPAFLTPAVPRGAAPTAVRPVPFAGTTPTPTPTPGPTPAQAPARAPAQAPAPPSVGPAAAPPAGPHPPGPPTYAPGWSPSSSAAPSTSGSGGSRRWVWGAAAAAVLAIVVGGTAALLVAGDGGGDPPGPDDPSVSSAFADGPADDIIAAAEKEMAVLDSVRLTGDLTTDGQPGTVDLTITSRGDCEGEIGVGEGRAQLRRVDGNVFLKPDRAFFESSGELSGAELDLVIGQIGDRWIRGDESDSAEFSDICDIDELLEGDGGEHTYEKGDVSEVDGAPVVAIRDTASGDELTAYVALDEPHYLVKLESAQEDGSFTFSDFDEEFSVEEPPADEIFEVPGG